MDVIQRYEEAKRSGFCGGNVSEIVTEKRTAPWLLLLNIIALILALAFSGYALWLASQKEPRAVVSGQIQEAQQWALHQLASDTALQQYVIDKFFSTTPQPGQRLTMLVCSPGKGCKTYNSPAKISPAQTLIP